MKASDFKNFNAAEDHPIDEWMVVFLREIADQLRRMNEMGATSIFGAIKKPKEGKDAS